ncbi:MULTISPECIES: hypothetical protein [Lysinibacillus]|uniref:hypothetical protein n=1 Tax=Lysinibacillus TaxID=400634 RepID=UPI000AB4ECD1|nr:MULTISPECIES: hypothetical protein [Lysinibacillus]
MKKIITGIVAMILMFSITAQFPATAAQIESEKKDNLSTILTSVLELDNEFDKAIGFDGDYIAIDTNLAKKQGATDFDIKLAILKVNEHNQIIKDTLAIQPFVIYDENSFYFDVESARKENVSEDLIESTSKDIELMNSVQPLAACNGKSKYEKTSVGFYTYFNSCQASTIITYIQIGAGIATLGAAIAAFIAPPLGLATIIAVGLIDIGATALNLSSVKECGLWIKWTGTVNPDPFWIGSQC